MSVENYLPGDLCSGLIICWRKSSGEMSPGEKFLGEKCDEFQYFIIQGCLSLYLIFINVFQIFENQENINGPLFVTDIFCVSDSIKNFVCRTLGA